MDMKTKITAATGGGGSSGGSSGGSISSGSNQDMKGYQHSSSGSDTMSLGSYSAWGSELGSNFGDAIGVGGEDNPYVSPKVAQKEEKMVLYSKIAVIFVLIAAVVGMAAGTHRMISVQENREFQTQVSNKSSTRMAYFVVERQTRWQLTHF